MKLNTMLATAIAVTAMIFVACSSDDTIDERRTAGAIGFGMLLDNSKTTNTSTGTRAASGTTVMDNTSFQNFRVWAYDAQVLGSASNSISNGGAMYMGTTDAAGVLIKSSASNSSGGYQFGQKTAYNVYWGYDDVADVKYWPKNYLQFFAVGPNAIDNITYSMPATYSGTNSFAYTADNSDLSKQKDIVVAAKRQAGSIGNSQVDLAFQHALSQIVFLGKVGANQPDLHVRVFSLSICNVNKTGTFTFPLQADGSLAATLAKTDWGTPSVPSTYAISPKSDATPDYIELTANATVTSDGTTTSLMNGGTSANDLAADPLFMIPQTVAAWDYSSNYNDATNSIVGGGTNVSGQADDSNQTGAYLKINCAIWQIDGVPIVGTYSSSTYTGEDVYVPLAVDWDPGKKYIYTLNFGIGRTNFGLPLGLPITFSVTSVAAWTDTTVNTNL